MHPDKVKEAHEDRVRLKILKKHAVFEEGYYAIKDLIEEGVGRHYPVYNSSWAAYSVFRKARPMMSSKNRLDTKEFSLVLLINDLNFCWNLPK